MKLGPSISFAAASLIFAGCFSPDGGTEADTRGTSEASTEGGETEDTAPTTTDNPTGAGSTTANPTGGTTTDDPTTGSPTTDDPTAGSPTTDDPSDSTSGGEDPFCGDGNIDAGEECDDGLENNGLEQGCLPDCNLNVCGDSNLGPDEFCDDGAGDNVLEVGACAPDCSRVIEEKVIRVGVSFIGGNLAPNPVGFADSRCNASDRALFAVPGVRQATNNTPNTADAQIGWPLRPYTAYTRPDGTLIWLTDEIPLLGVREGVAEPLTSPIVQPCVSGGGIFCAVLGPIITGLDNDWTNATADTCNGWTSASESFDASGGDRSSSESYLNNSDTPCSLDGNGASFQQPAFYCVEQ